MRTGLFHHLYSLSGQIIKGRSFLGNQSTKEGDFVPMYESLSVAPFVHLTNQMEYILSI